MRRPLRRWRPLGPRRLVCLRSAAVSRTRSRTSPPAGWSRRSSGRPPRTASRTPCRTSRRRGSRCRSSRRSRRSRLHAAPPMGTEDSGAVAPDRKATVTSRIVDQTTDDGRSITRSGGAPKVHRTAQWSTVPDARGTFVRVVGRAPDTYRLVHGDNGFAASEVPVVVASDRHRRRPRRRPVAYADGACG